MTITHGNPGADGSARVPTASHERTITKLTSAKHFGRDGTLLLAATDRRTPRGSLLSLPIGHSAGIADQRVQREHNGGSYRCSDARRRR